MKIQGVFLSSKYFPTLSTVICLLISLNSLCIVSAFPKPSPTILADVMSEDQVVVEEVMAMGMGMDMDMETTTAAPNTAGASLSSDDELVGLESKLELSQIMIQTTEVPSSVEAATPNYDDSSNYHSEQIQDQGKDISKIETPLESEYGASPVEVLNSNPKHLSNETVITHLNSTSLEPPHNSHAKREYDEDQDRDRDQEVRDHASLNNPESYDEESTPEGVPYGGAYGVLDNASVSKNEPGNNSNNNRNDGNSARDSSEGKLGRSGGSDLSFRRLVPESETESDSETDSDKPQPTEAIISTQSSDQDDSSSVSQSEPEPEPEAEAEPTVDVQEVVSTPDNIQTSDQIQSNSTSSSSSSSANPKPTSSGGDLTKLSSNADQDEAATTNSSQDPISLTVSTKTSQENDLPTIFSKTSQEDSHENTNQPQEQNLNLTATSQEIPVTVVQVHVQSDENNQNQQDETVIVVDDTTQTLSQDTDINAINPMAVDAETQGLGGPMNSDPVKYTDDSGQTSPPTSTLLDDAQKQDKIFVFKNNLQPAAVEGDLNHPKEKILPAETETDTSPFPEPGTEPEPVPAEEVEPRVEEIVVNQSQDDIMSMATSTPLPMLPMNVSESENIPEITPTNPMTTTTSTDDSNTEETRTTEIAPVTHSSPPQDEANNGMDSENITPESNFNSTVSPMTPTDSSNKPNPNSDSEFVEIPPQQPETDRPTVVVVCESTSKPKTKKPSKNNKSSWSDFLKFILPKSVFDVENIVLTAAQLSSFNF